MLLTHLACNADPADATTQLLPYGPAQHALVTVVTHPLWDEKQVPNVGVLKVGIRKLVCINRVY